MTLELARTGQALTGVATQGAATKGAAPTGSAAARIDVFVVSEDEPRQWRVANRANSVFGPFEDEAAALRVAFEGVRFSRRWEIHVLDQFGILICTYNSEEDAMHVRVDDT